MPAFVNITVATLFNSLWEAALLTIIAAIVLRLLPNLNATTRYAVWFATLVACVLLPLATAIPQIVVEHGAAAARTAAPQTAPAAIDGPVTHSAARPYRAQPVRAAASGFRLPARVRFALPETLALGVFAMWAAVALLFLVRLTVNLWKLERLKSDALPLPVDYRERLERWANADKGEREVRLCTCEEIEVPVAVGLFDSMILIPGRLLDTLSQDEVDQIILHELAHLRRADDWTNGLQRVIQALLFFNPAVMYIQQQLDLEREVACDDTVVQQADAIRPYATCLTKMAEAAAWRHRPLAAPGVFITRRGLSLRVERLLRAGRNVRTSVSFGPAGAVVATLVVVFFLLQTVAPSFAFTASAPASNVTVSKAPAAKARVVKVAIAPTATPAPRERTITIPARRIDIPARTIRVPAVHVAVPAKRVTFRVPAGSPLPPIPHVHVVFPANFSQTIRKAMAQGFSASGHVDCFACDYSKQNLSGKSFRGKRLTGTDFSKSDLRNADFSDSVLIGVDFSRSDLRGANFSNAKLTGCDFSRTQIDGVNFTNVTMTGCDIDARSLSARQAGSLLRGCGVGCDFSHADLRGQDLRNLNLEGIDLSHADLRGADLSGSRFQGVNFADARLEGARTNDARFSGCDFTGADLRGVDLSNATISGSIMSRNHR